MINIENVTVLVAVLNKKNTVEACIDSLLKLKEAPAKIMVVDGYSKDGTYEMLKGYGNKIKLLQYPENLSATFNWALNKISTEYVALTDGDCVVYPDWLEKLTEGFGEESVVAAAGYCGTPNSLSLFQTVIGLELESRFKRLPRFINRAPTMNLCIKTDMARKTGFDEKQMVAVEVDFGHRLTKLGKMAYVPEAKVLHYHRSSLKGYFKQQKDYAKWGLRLIAKHGRRAMADPITTLSMSAQIPVCFLGLSCLLFSFFNKLFLYPAAVLFLTLLFLYIKNIIEIKPPFRYYPLFIGLFILRTIAWMTGIIEGMRLAPIFFQKNAKNEK